METTKADLLIFGSSRANHHYQPDVFEKQLNLSYYNVGRDGNSIFYDYAILKSILKRYSPKLIILDFKAQEFIKRKENYDRLSFLLPYYRTHPEIRSIIKLKGPYEKLKLLSSIYPYNSSMFTIAVGNAKFNVKRTMDIKGYIPLTKVWNGSIQIDSSSYKYDIDSTEVKVYESFIQDCIHSKIQLYIVCSPYFIKYGHTDYSLAIGQEIAKKNNLMFFDYSQDSLFMNNSELFSDASHLNDNGARIFSGMLVDTISKTIGNNIRN
jgi:hypothetical protein